MVSNEELSGLKQKKPLNKKDFKKTILKFLASLKLAVLIIISIAVLTAIGTFVEAKYDATAAKKLVYDTFWMYIVMSALVVNLVAVMVDRWPWKRRHSAFVLAHVGIIIILLGALLTMKFGLDGSMRIEIGKESNLVTIDKTDLVVYSSFDGARYTELLRREVDFFRKPPTEKEPITIPTDEGDIQILEYNPYALPVRDVVESKSDKAGAGLRFQVRNANVSVVEWLVQRRPQDLETHDFGPAAIHLGPAPKEGQGRNEIFVTPQANQQLKVVFFGKDQRKSLKTAMLKEGDMVVSPWMGLEFRVLRFFPMAEEHWSIQSKERPTPLTTGAVRLNYKGIDQWVLLNDMVKLFSQNAVYIVSYSNRRVKIDSPIKLKKFEVGRYQGTMRAASYQSIVDVQPMGEVHISMNEPMKLDGLTFYQASFQDGPSGQPIASILSVNRDPGRWLKYLGSVVMSLGIVLLFWFKNMDWRLQKREGSKEQQ